MLDKKTFFDHIRPSSLFHGKMTQTQVNGIDAILDLWNSGPAGLFEGRVYDSHLAYMFATVYHETAYQMVAVREGDWPGHHTSDTWRKSHLRYFPWYGRGLVQLTWEANYKKMAAELKPFFPHKDVDMVRTPDLALDPEIAAAVLFYGMSRGSFTGKSLHTFIHNSTCDFYHARQIINMMDKAQTIAGYANVFNAAVKAATAAYHPPAGAPKAETAPAPAPHPEGREEITLSLPTHLVERLKGMDNPSVWVADQLKAG